MSPTGLITGTATQPGPFQLTFDISQPNGPKSTSMATLLVNNSQNICVFNGTTGATQQSFYAYSPEYRGGINVAAGDVDGDGKADILTGAGPGGDPHVKVFSGADGSQKQSFDAFATGFNGGVSVASADLNQDGKADIIAGTQTQSAQVKAFSAIDLSVIDDFFAFQGAVGVWVAGK